MKTFSTLLILLFLTCCSPGTVKPTDGDKPLPNIIILYVDDLGYGDVGEYGAAGVLTPNIDRLAREGLRFTDAYSTAATCSPSRYSLLTGRYAFRRNASVLPGDAPLMIPAGSATIASMLQRAGYRTAVVGKWHLGLGDGNLNWNQDIRPGPLEIGFDYAFLLPATGDRVPSVYVENHAVVGLSDEDDPLEISYSDPIGDMPTGLSHPQLLRQSADRQHSDTIVNGISRIGFMDGGDSAHWRDEDFADLFVEKAVAFIEDAGNRNQTADPFFLYFSFHDIHVPRLPNERFVGASEMGPRGDAIAQVDWMTGQIVQTLERLQIDDNTLIIFTSDNGPVLDDGYADRAVELLGAHRPAGALRGGKYSAFEAGTRVPTIAYWPDSIEPGTSHALLSQVDFFATLASISGQNPRPGEAIDSENLATALLSAEGQGRDALITQSATLGIRRNDWKYIEPIAEGKTIPTFVEQNKNIESGFSRRPQLYDLSLDPGEQNNLVEQFPELAAELQDEIDRIRTSEE